MGEIKEVNKKNRKFVNRWGQNKKECIIGMEY
jgi:hypothetical protein